MSRALGSKYTLGESIGRGAMGEAFRGTDRQGNVLAFKLLHAELATDIEVVERFVRERSILLALRGENLVEVHDLVIEGDTLGIVMDLVAGGDLRTAIRNHGPFTPSEVCRIGAGIARGLSVVHATGIIHRDIKPANILLGEPQEAPVPKLTDFGISSLVDVEHVRTSTVVGTPQYIAPEIAAGHPAVAESDLYSLGIVLYEMAVGVTPFAGGSIMAVLLRHSTASAARPEGVPDALWELITQLLAKDPLRRPGAAEQVAEKLEALSTVVAGIPAAPRLEEPLEPVPLLGKPVGGAVSMPQLDTSTALALAPGLEASPPSADTLGAPTLRPTVALTSATSRQSMENHPASDPMARPGTPRQSPPVSPAAGNGSSGHGPEVAPAKGGGSGGALWVVSAIVLAVLLLAGALVFAYLNGQKAAPQPAPSPTETAGQQPSPTAATETTQGSEAPAKSGAPDMIGLTEAQARAALPSGVRISITRTTSLDVQSGQISAQEPKAGQPLGNSMKLTIEAGIEDPSPTADAQPTPAQGSWLDINGATLKGNVHEKAVGLKVCGSGSPTSGKIVYDLSGKYTTFTATVALANESATSEASAHIDAVVDGTVYDSATISESSFREWDIDLNGVKKLEFDWTQETCGAGATVVGFGSPFFTGNDG